MFLYFLEKFKNSNCDKRNLFLEYRNHFDQENEKFLEEEKLKNNLKMKARSLLSKIEILTKQIQDKELNSEIENELNKNKSSDYISLIDKNNKKIIKDNRLKEKLEILRLKEIELTNKLRVQIRDKLI